MLASSLPIQRRSVTELPMTVAVMGLEAWMIWPLARAMRSPSLRTRMGAVTMPEDELSRTLSTLPSALTDFHVMLIGELPSVRW